MVGDGRGVVVPESLGSVVLCPHGVVLLLGGLVRGSAPDAGRYGRYGELGGHEHPLDATRPVGLSSAARCLCGVWGGGPLPSDCRRLEWYLADWASQALSQVSAMMPCREQRELHALMWDYSYCNSFGPDCDPPVAEGMKP